MRKRKKVAIVVFITMLVAVWLIDTRTDTIRYHLDCLQALQAWPRGPATLKDYFRNPFLLRYKDGRLTTPQVFEKIQEHQEALVQLGYFVTHDFVLVHRTFDADSKAISDLNTLFTASKSAFKNITTWTVPHGKSSIVRVIARQEDIPAWESIISRFDSQETR